jgi:hypothetical protein
LEDPGVDGRIMLRWIFNRLEGWCIDWIGLAHVGTGGGLLWMR